MSPFLDGTGAVVDQPITALRPSTCVIVYVPYVAGPLGAPEVRWYVLVHQRRDNAHWGFLGGAQEPGESLRACAFREVLEESGLVVDLERLVAVDSDPAQGALCRYPDGAVVQYSCTVFTARPHGVTAPGCVTGALPVLRCSDESLDLRWVPADALPEPFLVTHRWRLAQARDVNRLPAFR